MICLPCSRGGGKKNGIAVIAVIAVIARNRRDRKDQIPAMSAIPGDSGDLLAGCYPSQFAGRVIVNNLCSLLPATNYLPGESFHFLQLWAELEQEQVNARILKLGNTFPNLLRRSHQTRPQTAAGHRVIFERNALFQLSIREPLLVVCVSGAVLLDVSNVLDLTLI